MSDGCSRTRRQSEVHLIDRMLFRSPKVTFGSVSNEAFEDALDIRSAITVDRFWMWCSQALRVRYTKYTKVYCEVCVACTGVPGAAGCLCSDDHGVRGCGPNDYASPCCRE